MNRPARSLLTVIMSLPERTRRELAAWAARLVAEDGRMSLREARHRAAEHLQVVARDTPDDQDILDALREHLSLFDPDQAQAVRELRQAALAVMDALADFRPQVIGCAAEGLAPEGALIELIVWADSEKEVEMTLMGARIAYDVAPTRDPRRVVIHCHGNEPAVDLHVLAPGQAPGVVRAQGRSQAGVRLSREALVTLLEADPAGPQAVTGDRPG